MIAPQTAASRLSVVIPTHNRRDLVVRAIDSVLAQARDLQCEVIVVDDGSVDGTDETVFRKYRDDPRVSLLRSVRRHASGARNLGFAAARGSYVCFLDSDDYWLPGTVETVVAIFRDHPHLGFVSVDGGTIETVHQPALQRIVAGDAPGWSHADFPHHVLASERRSAPDARNVNLLYGDFFPAIVNGDLFYLSGLIIRREVVERAGPFNERFRYFNDWEFFARVCSLGPGAYVDYDGFRRATGQPDQISRRRAPTAMARRRLFIVHTQQRRFAHAAESDRRQVLQRALDDAHYAMARCLADTPHRQWCRWYLYRCIRRGHKVLRCLALLAGGRFFAQ
ncbi:MAG TPA: glycosyltransferase [Rudaea sp.]|jgi:glycosyltransferase involved in cell wall biosynthesis